MAANDITSELDSFREQWRAEVQSKVPGSKNEAQQTVAGPSNANHTRHKPRSKAPKSPEAPKIQPPIAVKQAAPQSDDEDEYVSRSFDDSVPAETPPSHASEETSKGSESEQVSALEHFEQAVEREAAGNLGDSVRLYRKAYRMDHRVDLQYRKKHFPQAWQTMAAKPAAPGQPNPSNPAPTMPNSAHHSSADDPPAKPKSLKVLIASFAGLSIQGAASEGEGVPPPPCPISELPDEILVHILRDVAVSDIASFVRLARVCRRLAYLVVTEDQIWRRVCLGPEFGFGGMHYRWQTSVAWGPLDAEEDEAISSGPNPSPPSPDTTTESTTTIAPVQQAAQDLVPLTPTERTCRDNVDKETTTLSLLTSTYSSSWQRMFLLRPRIRFGGCYISTVNYLRSGQASANATTWHSPVHIVTYYRYLRFYRDGTCVSLLTTAEPGEASATSRARTSYSTAEGPRAQMRTCRAW